MYIVKRLKLQTCSFINFVLKNIALKRKKAHTGQIKGVTVGLNPLKKEKTSIHLIVSRLVVSNGNVTQF